MSDSEAAGSANGRQVPGPGEQPRSPGRVCGCGSRVIGFRVRPDFFVTLLFPNESGGEKELRLRRGTSLRKKFHLSLFLFKVAVC